MQPLDKVGHVGNLLPLFEREFAQICQKRRLTMRRYINADGNILTSKAASLTVHLVMYVLKQNYIIWDIWPCSNRHFKKLTFIVISFSLVFAPDLLNVRMSGSEFEPFDIQGGFVTIIVIIVLIVIITSTIFAH